MLKIETQNNNAVLRKKSAPVAEITSAVLSLIKDMKLTLAQSQNGVGLAAPQVGRNIRLFVISDELAKDGHTVFINPAITQVSKKDVIEEEGCLSLPNQWHELARPDKVTIKALDENGQKFKLRVKGILARLMLHEVDHLNGILFVDHLKKI
ncbi:MAG: peptide deformylase [Parcubacteria group bacterium]|nr:peptide deformylase [Parcubacteria group bacterium]